MRINSLTSWKKLASKMLVPLAVACASLCGACSDEFDDTQLKNDIKDLKDRVTALEEKLSSEIESLRTLINGKTTIDTYAYNEETGIYTILLTNGQTLEVAKANADAGPLVSVVQENGKYYWTVGGEPLLDSEGQKVPVEVSPGVRVNPSTDMWEISPDGGRTWHSTGIRATEEGGALVSKVSDDATWVYFSLADGTQIKVAKNVDYRCKIIASKQYFESGATRKVNLDMNGVSKSAVYSKPEGWKASVTDNVLSITAPAADTGDKSGKVIVQVWYSDRTSDISEVEVEIGIAPHDIVVANEKSISFTVSDALGKIEKWAGYTYGAVDVETFTEEWVMTYVKNNTRIIWEKAAADNKTLAALLGSAPEKGKSYVVWCLDKFSGSYGSEATYSPVYYTMVSVSNIAMNALEVTYEDATISVMPTAIASYCGGVFEKGASTLAAEIGYINEGDYTVVKGSYEGLLSAYARSPFSPKITTGKTYIAYAIPYVYGKTDYTEEDAYSLEIAIPAVTFGGTASVSVEMELTPISVKATVTRGAGVYKHYSAYLSAADMAKYQKDEDLLAYLLTKPGVVADAYEVSRDGLNPKTPGQIAAVGVDKEGKAGEIVKKDATTPEITYSDKTVKVERTAMSYDSATFKLTPDAGIVRCMYYLNKKTAWTGDFLFGRGDIALTTEAMYKYKNEPVFGKTFEVLFENGQPAEVTLTKLTRATEYVFFVMGFDENDVPTQLFNTATADYFTPELSEKIIRMDSEQWKNSTAHPIVSDAKVAIRTLDPETNKYYDKDYYLTEITKEIYLNLLKDKTPRGAFSATITPGEGCKEFYVFVGGGSYIPSDYIGKTVYILSNSAQAYTETYSPSDPYFSLDGNRIAIAWRDADGALYEAEVIDILGPERPTDEERHDFGIDGY